MSIQLKLDTGALRALLEDNPDFKLVLTNAVMANIRNDVTDSAVVNKIQRTLNELVTKTSYPTKLVWNDDGFRALVTQIAQEHALAIVESTITRKIEEYVELQGRAKLKTILHEILVNSITDEQIAAAIQARMAKFLANSSLS